MAPQGHCGRGRGHAGSRLQLHHPDHHPRAPPGTPACNPVLLLGASSSLTNHRLLVFDRIRCGTRCCPARTPAEPTLLRCCACRSCWAGTASLRTSRAWSAPLLGELPRCVHACPSCYPGKRCHLALIAADIERDLQTTTRCAPPCSSPTAATSSWACLTCTRAPPPPSRCSTGEATAGRRRLPHDGPRAPGAPACLLTMPACLPVGECRSLL